MNSHPPAEGVRASLTGLTWEIRRQILRHLLDVHVAREIWHHRRWQEPVKYVREAFLPRMHRRRVTSCELQPAILKVCKQLYQEGLQVLIHENHFVAILVRRDSTGSEDPARSFLHRFWDEGQDASWMPKWKWLHSDTGFETPGGLYCPDLTIFHSEDSGSGEQLIPVVIPLASLPEVAMCIRARGTTKPLRDPCFHFHFGSRLPRKIDGEFCQVPLSDFLTKGLFMWLGDYVKSSTVVEWVDETGRAEVLQDKQQDQLLASLCNLWRTMDLKEKTKARNRYAYELVHEIQAALKNGAPKRAFTILQELCRQVHCRGKHADQFSTSHPLQEEQDGWDLLVTIFSVACYHVTMQDRWPESHFGSQRFFHEWAKRVIHLAHMQVLGEQWLSRTGLRLAELQLRLGQYPQNLPTATVYGLNRELSGGALADDSPSSQETITRYLHGRCQSWIAAIDAMEVEGLCWMPSGTEIQIELEQWKSEMISRFGKAPDWSFESLEAITRDVPSQGGWL